MSYLSIPHPAPAYTSLDSAAVKLTIRQQPHHALVTNDNKEKGRKPIDPPPIVQMHVESTQDPNEYWLVNPFLFMMAMIVDAKTEVHVGPNVLIGQNVSSLHRLKDTNNKDGGFYVFGDISVRKTGSYKLQFNLYDYDKVSGHAILIDTVLSKEFNVVSTKDFKGLAESTILSRHFSDQGVRLRLRKEPRANTGTKRTWSNTSPPEPSTPAGLYGGPVHAHTGYDVAPLKRQRSSEDYGSSYLYNSYQVRPSAYGTSYSSDGSNGHWATAGLQHDATKGYSGEATTSSLTGMMTPTGQHPSSAAMWQRGLPLSAYGGAVGSTPVSSSGGGGGGGGDFPNGLSGGSTNSASSRDAYSHQYSTPQHQQHQHQHPTPLSSNYATLRSSTGSDTYPTLNGLPTPTSLSDSLGSSTGPSGSGGGSGSGSGNAHSGSHYLPSSSDVHSAAGGASHHAQHGMAHFTGRGLTLEQPLGGAGGLHESAAGGSGTEYLF